MKDYELFNDSMRMDEPYEPQMSYHKFDFTSEVEGYNQLSSSKPSVSPQLGSVLATHTSNTSENKGLIEVKDPKALQRQLEAQLMNAGPTSKSQIHRKIPVAKVEPNTFKKVPIKSIPNKMYSSEDSDSDASPGPKHSRVERKPSAAPIVKGIIRAQSMSKNSNLKQKKEDADKIGLLVQDDMSFGDTSSSGGFDQDSSSDSFDERSEKRSNNGKIKLRKLETNLPETLELKVAPSEALDDFFDDPIEHPLLPSNRFTKFKSEAPRAIGGLRQHKSLFGGLNKPRAKDDTQKQKYPIKSAAVSGTPIPKQDIIREASARKEESSKKIATLIDTAVEKVASKTFYGISPLEMAKKLDQEEEAKEEPKKEEISEIKKDDTPEEKPKVNTFLGFKEPNQPSKPSSSTPFGGSSGANIFQKKSESTMHNDNPTLSTGTFGQSSLSQAIASNPTQGFGAIAQVGRTFGGANKEPTTGFTGFKSIIGSSQPSTSTFLASGANKQDDNDMAEDDIFGTGLPTQPSGITNPSPFNQNAGNFGQPNNFIPSGTISTSLGFDPKSNPSFTTRRK